jgi:hypothetical protein
MTDGHQRQQRPLRAAVESQERPVVPTGALRRTTRLAVLPLRHAARTAAAASRLSRAATDQVASRTAEQVFATLGELKGGAAKLGQAMSVFEAALPEEVAAPYRSALRRLTDAAPAMPAEVARRVVAADLTAAYGPGWQSGSCPSTTWPQGRRSRRPATSTCHRPAVGTARCGPRPSGARRARRG